MRKHAEQNWSIHIESVRHVAAEMYRWKYNMETTIDLFEGWTERNSDFSVRDRTR